MMGIFSLVSFRSENILSLELFLHALLEGTDFSTLKFCILKCLRNGKNRNNRFSFSTGGVHARLPLSRVYKRIPS